MAIFEFKNRVRRRLKPWLHGYLTPHDWYSKGSTPESQFVGTVDKPVHEVRWEFIELDIWPNVLAALKYRGDSLDESDPVTEVSSGSWALRDHFFGHYQVHFTIYQRDEQSTDIFAHFELAPARHPIAHVDMHQFDTDLGVAVAVDVLPWFDDVGDIPDAPDISKGVDHVGYEAFGGPSAGETDATF